MVKRKTKLMRVYSDDYEEMKFKFPNVTSANYFHMINRTNPFIQVEAMLRGKVNKKNVKK